MRARFIDFPKYSCIIGRIWLTLTKSLESVVFIEKAANFSLKLLIFKDFCKYNLLIIKYLTIEFYFLSSTKKLDLEYSSRQHPTATLIYQNKEYITYINSVDSLQIGLNNTTFFYDELFDRVFCRNSGIAKGQYVALVFFILSFLLWLEPNSNINNKKKRHNR